MKLSFFNLHKKEKPVLQTISPVTYCFSDHYAKNKYFKNVLENCIALKTTLVQASYYFCCDENTAKYRGRVFDLTGKSETFPPLTDDVLKCNLSFSPFIYGVSIFYVYDKKCDPVDFSNRPFVDDRTDEEKLNYEKILHEEQTKLQTKKEYTWITKNLPELAPKSLSGYSKMKNSNSGNFQKIVNAAIQKGYRIKE